MGMSFFVRGYMKDDSITETHLDFVKRRENPNEKVCSKMKWGMWW